MALAVDTSIDFNSDAGYTYDAGNVEFVGGIARIKAAAAAGAYSIVAPGIDTQAASWSNVHRVEIDVTETASAGGALYYHRFLVSFDGGSSFNRYTPAGWERLDLAGMSLQEIADIAMPVEVIEAAREWPDPSDIFTLVFGILLVKESGASLGAIDQISIFYRDGVDPTSDFEETVLAGEPDGSDPLPEPNAWPGGSIEPDFVVHREVQWPSLTPRTEAGYELGIAIASTTRSAFELTWSTLDSADRDTLVDFLRAHYDAAFVWTPPGFASAKKFVIAREPEIETLSESGGAHRIRAIIIETLP
jgi:hypothetical protein